MHLDPVVLVPLEPELAGYPWRQVNAGGIQDLPAKLVFTLVVVLEVGRLGLGGATGEVVPHVPVLARLPVIVPDVPRPDFFYFGLGSVFAAADANRVPTPVLQYPVRQGDLAPGV